MLHMLNVWDGFFGLSVFSGDGGRPGRESNNGDFKLLELVASSLISAKGLVVL